MHGKVHCVVYDGFRTAEIGYVLTTAELSVEIWKNKQVFILECPNFNITPHS
jgi:hypothetical protein